MSAGAKPLGGNPNIYLVGFMGAGKTTVGKLLADKIGRRFVDTDSEIVKRVGKSISQIFSEDGEPFFREVESEVISEISTSWQLVVSLGGGAVLREQNRQKILVTGKSVFLKWPEDVLIKRIEKNPDRPLVTGLARTERRNQLKKLIRERQPVYEKCDITLVCGQGMAPEQICLAILRKLNLNNS